MPASFRPSFNRARLCAIAGLAAIAIAGCTTEPPTTKPAPVAPTAPTAPVNVEKPSYLRLPNLVPDQTPLRVGIILPFSSASAATRGLANSMMKAAELALFDSKNNTILLMTADEGASPADAAVAAHKLLDQGAEVIVGPLFGPSAASVAPVARAAGVPVLSFSTERRVAGDGVYLLSFLPQSEVKRVVSYAAAEGRSHFTALVPKTAYGDVVAASFDDEIKTLGLTGSVVRFTPDTGTVAGPATAAAKTGADAILVAQGGTVLKAIAPTLTSDAAAKVKLLGTGLWSDPALAREGALSGGWFAAPPPDAETGFAAKYHDAFGATPPPLASLAYDAVSLVALLAPGVPFQRLTRAALMDPNGFAGVDGIFRFNADGTSERGLAILQVGPDGFSVADPAPKTFQAQGF